MDMPKEALSKILHVSYIYRYDKIMTSWFSSGQVKIWGTFDRMDTLT